MHLCRFIVLVGFLIAETVAITVSLDSTPPAESPQRKHEPHLPVLAKQKPQSQFAARFEQTEPIIAGDTFYYSSTPSSAPVSLARTETQTFMVLFDFDSSQLNAESKIILDNVVNIAKRGQLTCASQNLQVSLQHPRVRVCLLTQSCQDEVWQTHCLGSSSAMNLTQYPHPQTSL